MTIDEAIRRLEQHTRWLEWLNALEQLEAHQLGIEALEREERRRRFTIPDKVDLLPGETLE